MRSSMAETDSDNGKHQKLVPGQKEANPSKSYSQFLYKGLVVIVFVVILQLFPSQAPEFINQTVLTRSWELLHLVFVGIAVSYGLFSRRNDEAEKENNNTKFDNAQSYVSRFLQVSSVFDDEPESPSGRDENKVQTWSSQYYRNEPVVVVAQEHSVLDEQRSTGEKPLLLPVRSLKQRMPEPGVAESANESERSGSSGSVSRSNSKLRSKRFSGNPSKSRDGELEVGALDHVELDEKLRENVVLPSPIPWRSRSGRIEMKEEVDGPPLYILPISMEESDFSRVESRSSRSPITSLRTTSNTTSPKLSHSPPVSSPRKLSPSPSLSAESQAKNADDFVRKKSFYKSSPPPPPPPPPPMIRKSSSIRPNSGLVRDGASLEMDMRRSFTNEQKDLNRSGGESLMDRLNFVVEMEPRSHADSFTRGKSVRRVRAGEAMVGARRGGDAGEETINWNLEKRTWEAQPFLVEKSGRKTVGFDQTSMRTEKLSPESVPIKSKPTFMEFPEEEREDFVDTVTVVYDEDAESEDDDIGVGFFQRNIGGSPSNGTNLSNEEAASNSVSDGGPDVDKKADEFIAKFREQIRLQRIESIKKSSGQIKKNSSSQS